MALILLVVSYTVSATDIPQSISLRKKNAPLSEVLVEITAQAGYDFFYSQSDITQAKPVTVNLENKSIEVVLQEVFKGQPLAYEIMKQNNAVVIKLANNTEGNQQNNEQQQIEKIDVKGRVVDKNGEPLPSAYIIVQSEKKFTTTNSNGEFELEGIALGAIVQIRFVGYGVKELPAAETMTITLEAAINEFEEVRVVSTGYQTLPAERSVGSFSQITSSQLETRPASSNVLERIEGTAAGLNYTNGVITIRGGSSINLSNEPLVVVDGFPITGNIETINPEDIETIDILKDAAAASIWGVRASNGVVVITTKKGRINQRFTVDLSYFKSITQKIDYSNQHYVNAAQQIEIEQEYFRKGWVDFGSIAAYGETVTLLGEAETYRRGMAPEGNIWSQAQYNNYINDLKTRDVEKQWEDYLLRNAMQDVYNLSISAGGEKNTAYLSMVFNDNKEASIGNANRRLIFNLNDTYTFNDLLQIKSGITVSWMNALNNGIDPASIYDEQAYNNLKDENGQLIPYYRRYNKWISKEREDLTGISYSYNPIEEVMYNDNANESLNVRAQFGLRLEPIKGLIGESSFQYEKGYGGRDTYYSMQNYAQRWRIADFFVNDEFQFPAGTLYDYQKQKSDSWDFRNTLSFNKNWEKHQLNLFGGFEIRKYTGEILNDRKFGFDKQTTQYVPVDEAAIASQQVISWDGTPYYESNNYYGVVTPFELSNYDNREISAFANGAYEFDNKYSINGSFRIDQKNLFGSDPAFRYKPLWSTGVAWTASNEEFMKDISWINRLRLRATIGINGNAGNSSPYAQATSVVQARGSKLYNFLRFSSPENQSLKWEETRVFNLGIDFHVFDNRLSGIIEYYNKQSNDLLGSRPVDPTNGFNSAMLNYASMNNKGVELTLNARVVDTNDFNWQVSANLTYNKNRITDLEAPSATPYAMAKYSEIYGVQADKPFNAIYSFNYAGLDNAGRILVTGTNGDVKSWKDGVDDLDELIYHGSTTPPWFGGLRNTWSYKGLDFSVNLTYKFGAVFRRIYQSSSLGFRTMMEDVWTERWQKPGDEATTRIPRLSWYGVNPETGQSEGILDAFMGEAYWQFSQDFIYSADFVRVRDIILGYTLPRQLVNKTFLSNVRFTFNVTNPYLWVANEKGYDPEAPYTQAFDNLKTYTFGVRATF